MILVKTTVTVFENEPERAGCYVEEISTNFYFDQLLAHKEEEIQKCFKNSLLCLANRFKVFDS